MKQKVGPTLTLVAFLMVAIPMWRSSSMSSLPFSAPLPLKAGATLDETFFIPGSGPYVLSVRTRGKGLLKGEFTGLNDDSLVTNFHLQLSHSGHTITQDVERIPVATYAPHDEGLEWRVTSIPVTSAGRYHIQLQSLTDLGYLENYEPMLLFKLGSLEAMGRNMTTLMGQVIGIPLFLFGVISTFRSRRKRNEEQARSEV